MNNKMVNIKKRYVSEITKKHVVILQNFKCANSPNSNLKNIGKYKCHLYQIGDGSFNESGWEIDHIVEFSIGGSDDISNLQALCVCCHQVKTNNFTAKKTEANNSEIIEIIKVKKVTKQDKYLEIKIKKENEKKELFKSYTDIINKYILEM